MLDSFIYFILYTYQARIFIASTTTSASILYCYIYIYWYTYTYLHILHIHLHPHLHMEASQDGGTPSPHPWNIWGISMSNARRSLQADPEAWQLVWWKSDPPLGCRKKTMCTGGEGSDTSVVSEIDWFFFGNMRLKPFLCLMYDTYDTCGWNRLVFFCWTYICVWFEIVSLKHFSSCVSPQNDES